MNNPKLSKLIFRQLVRTCFALCVTLAFVINPFTPILALEKNNYNVSALPAKDNPNGRELDKNIKNNLQLKSKIIQIAYKEKFHEELSKGYALTLAGNTLLNKNSYRAIYKTIKNVTRHCEEQSDEAISKTLEDCRVGANAPPRNDENKLAFNSQPSMFPPKADPPLAGNPKFIDGGYFNLSNFI